MHRKDQTGSRANFKWVVGRGVVVVGDEKSGVWAEEEMKNDIDSGVISEGLVLTLMGWEW